MSQDIVKSDDFVFFDHLCHFADFGERENGSLPRFDGTAWGFGLISAVRGLEPGFVYIYSAVYIYSYMITPTNGLCRATLHK